MVKVQGRVLQRLLPGIVDSKLRMHKKFITISHGGRHKFSYSPINRLTKSSTVRFMRSVLQSV